MEQLNIIIEKNVPIPAKTIVKGKSIYPWREMEVNDSVLFPITEDTTKAKLGTKVISSAKNFGNEQNPKWKFVSRALPEGIRVWRVS